MTQAIWKKESKPLTPRVMRLIREAVLYALVAVAVYLFLLLWTYHPADPGWSHSGGGRAVANYGGPVGAWLADVLLHLFGYIAYLFPLMAATAAIRLFFNRNRTDPPDVRHQLITGSGFVLTLLGGGGLANLHFTNMAIDLPFTSGGMLGAFVGGSLVSAFSFIGTTVFLLALFLAGVTLFSGLSWMRLMDAVGRWGLVAFARAKHGLSIALDYVIGMQALRARRETVAKDMRVLDKHTPPRIEPVLREVPKSARVERERQVPLFEPVVSGELPALSLLDAPRERKQSFSKQSLETMSRLVEKKLLDFDIEVQVVDHFPDVKVQYVQHFPGLP